MKSSYTHICRLLASSGYQEREISEFFNELIKRGPNAAIGEIESIRRYLKNTDQTYNLDVPTVRVSAPISDTAYKIERLLINDAGIPKTVAIGYISEELRRRYPSIQIPAESRKGFNSWIRRLIAHIPEKELLHIATNIRNRSVHDLPTDWRLK